MDNFVLFCNDYCRRLGYWHIFVDKTTTCFALHEQPTPDMQYSRRERVLSFYRTLFADADNAVFGSVIVPVMWNPAAPQDWSLVILNKNETEIVVIDCCTERNRTSRSGGRHRLGMLNLLTGFCRRIWGCRKVLVRNCQPQANDSLGEIWDDNYSGILTMLNMFLTIVRHGIKAQPDTYANAFVLQELPRIRLAISHCFRAQRLDIWRHQPMNGAY